MSTKQGKRWSNWSGSVTCTPRVVMKPRTLDELIGIVHSCVREHRHIRVAGAGHSFVPLVHSDDVLLSLQEMRGLEAVDAAGRIVTVRAGTRLRELGKALFEHGLAQESLGDIDAQSIAGAISTGTHGTGVRFGTLSMQVEGLTLVTAAGQVLECSLERDPELFRAAQVSLGALGIIASVKLRVTPAQRMHFQSSRKSLSDCITHLEHYKQENDHFEFLWFPYTNAVQAKFLNETTQPASKSSLWNTFNKIVLENGVYWVLSEACRLVPSLCRTVCAISGHSLASVEEINYGHRLFTTPRWVRFNEMEYNIPAQHAQTVLGEIGACIERHRFAVHFPIECRFVKADDIWLSPAYQRESAYIAVHMYRGMPYKPYFRHVEAIFKQYQGRPHWGKIHTRSADELAALYPRWHDFRRVRGELDPQGLFLNDYLRELFTADAPVGPTTTAPLATGQEEQAGEQA